MLTLNYSGWNKDYGAYSFDIPFDDTKTDWEIQFKKDVYYQLGPFTEITRDWNCDGDVYAQYGAWFGEEPNGFARDFYTPERMLRLVIDEEATIPGLPDPSAPIKEHREEQLRKADEAERAKRVRSVSVKDEKGRETSVPFDANESNYRIHLATGKRFFQTSDFDERPESWVDRGESGRPVFGAWFQSDAETLEARYFTPEELVRMAVSKEAVIEGFDLDARKVGSTQPAHDNPAKKKHRSREEER